MATIKLQGGAVLLSAEGAVRCTCCGECCMYPAQGFKDGVYTAADLPDALELYMTDTFALFGPQIAGKNEDGSYGSEALTYFVRVEDDEWITTFNQIDPSQECLIPQLIGDDPPDVEDIPRVWVFDRFEDNYSFTTPEGSGTLARESLCVWRGDGRTLTFVSGSTFVGWTFGGVRKGGAQNSPVGTYGAAQIS
jgi:hypothetical protein